ncbi:MAG: flagellin [Candidatus Dactylopiibacterium carminicum]|nr:MAG: flagellin [Candidatus Dactylopiibacterium carminicum]
MALTINTNVASLNAQRNITSTQSSLNTSLQRLSSGLRINSAKDDAAGLAISERMSSQIKGLSVASRNANDGISLAQTAEGALVEIGNNLQRIRELSVQASNASNSKSDREALQSEVKQLIYEIDRVANQTSFNGEKLLNGDFTNKLFQVGADTGQTIGINKVVDANVDTLGKVSFIGPVTGVSVSGVDATGSQVTGTITINYTTTAADGTTGSGTATTDTITIAAGTTDGDAAAAVAAAINAKMDLTGVYAEVADDGSLTYSSVKANQTFDVGVLTGIAASGASATDLAVSGTVTNVEDIDISTFVGAQQALEVVDKALTEVNSARADMGAVQNRFSSTIANLATSSENLSASRGRIVDADFASETANLSRAQILQQAGTAMLAQANALPQQVLSLLQ